MLNLNQTYELLAGGQYLGNASWSKKRSEIDNCFKIYQLTKGEVFILDEKQTYKIEANKLFFINGAKLMHQHCNCSFSAHWLHFIPKDIILYQGLLSLPTVVELTSEDVSLSAITPCLEDLLASNTTSVWQYSLDVLKAQTLIQTSILELFSKHFTKVDFISNKVRRIEPAIQYMNKYYKESIKLDKLANLCYMSPNYFHKIFKKTLSTTPANYLILLRMNASLQLLANKQQTIKEIALELGFTDAAHFNRTFKKYYGIPPGEYQKKRQDIFL